MVQCKLCRSNSNDQYLLTVCQHAICLPCCYVETDFTTMQIKCCGIHTTIEREAMTQIIRQKKPQRKQTEPVQDNNCSYIHKQARSLNQSRGSEMPTRKSRWEDLKQKSFNRSNQSNRSLSEQKKSKQADEVYYYPPQQLTFQKIHSSQNLQREITNKKCLNELQNILLLQIQKVKNQFDNEHERLRKKEDALIKHLMTAYEEEIKNIDRPIMAAKLENFDISMGRFNSRIKENIRSQTISRATENENVENESTNHYDPIIKKLEINKQRMYEKIQKHFTSLA